MDNRIRDIWLVSLMADLCAVKNAEYARPGAYARPEFYRGGN